MKSTRPSTRCQLPSSFARSSSPAPLTFLSHSLHHPHGRPMSWDQQWSVGNPARELPQLLPPQ
eukprot:6362084-Heterocapsa_arctica.AAC.1